MDDKEIETRRREKISDCLLVGGGVAVSLGLGLLHIAAGVIAGGFFAIAYGWLIAQGGGKK